MPDDLDKRFTLLRAYKALGVESSATDDEVKQAHRDLVRVWHPDRFEGDARMCAKAEGQLKTINAAFDSIMNERRLHAPKSVEPTPKPTPKAKPKPTAKSTPKAEPAPKPSTRTSDSTPKPKAGTTAPQKVTPKANTDNSTASLFVAALAIAIALLIAASASSAHNANTSQTGAFAEASSTAVSTPTPPPPTAKQRAAAKKAAAAARAEAAKQARAAKKAAATRRAQEARQARAAAQNAAAWAKVITLGDTDDKVRRVQGTPSSIIGDTWDYGFSSVYFSNGRVTGWSVIDQKLRVAVAGGSKRGARFGLGSSTYDVATAQGTPSSIIGDTWGYGFSSVYFSNGRVTGWSVIDQPLKLR